MKSNKLLNLFLFSIVLVVVHGLEEYFTGFHNVDWSFLLIFGRFSNNLAVTYILYQIALYALLFALYACIKKGIWVKPIVLTVSIIMVLELQHVYELVITGKYYPGAYTAILFPVLAFALWRELKKLAYTKI